VKRLLSAVLVVVASWAVVAPAGAVTATARLHAKLLNVSQLPSGWLKEATSSVEVFGCTASAFPSGPTATASVSFNYGGPKSFPLITEELGTFKSSSTAFAALTGGLNGCKSVSGTAHGGTFTGTITKMSFASLGNQSAAYAAKITLSGSVLAADIVIVRKGSELMDFQEGNFTSVSAGGFRTFATAAAARL
jgi:hypothetical protein